MSEAESATASATYLTSPMPVVSSTTTTKTPPRNNYANTHTPIASIKRPRSSIEQNTTPKRSQTSETALSPLHPPTTAVVRDDTENEIFSPGVLRWDGQDDANDAADGLDAENHVSVVVSVAQRKVTDDADDDNRSRQSDASLSVMEIDVDDEFNPWQFIKSLPPYSSVSHLTPPVALEPKDPRFDLSLVLDLDETLVHCTVEAVEDADFSFPVLFHGMEYQVYVRLRPHLFEFLKRVQDLKMETIVFTASQKVYADELLNRIDPDNKFFHHRLFRESCLHVEGNFLKDLNVLGRDLSKTVLVDNSPHAFGYQIDNGVPIESWFDNPSDRELLKLERFLRQLSNETDVRLVCQRKFHLGQRVLEAPEYTG